MAARLLELERQLPVSCVLLVPRRTYVQPRRSFKSSGNKAVGSRARWPDWMQKRVLIAIRSCSAHAVAETNNINNENNCVIKMSDASNADKRPSSHKLPGDFVYLIQDVTNKSIIKFGRSKNIRQRLDSYRTGSPLYLGVRVTDSIIVETRVLEKLRSSPELCKQRRDLGKEWFELVSENEFSNLFDCSTKMISSLGFVDQEIPPAHQVYPARLVRSRITHEPVSYTCPRCGYTTTQRFSLLQHFRRKAPCNNTNPTSNPAAVNASTILLSNFATLSPCTTFRMQI